MPQSDMVHAGRHPTITRPVDALRKHPAVAQFEAWLHKEPEPLPNILIRPPPGRSAH